MQRNDRKDEFFAYALCLLIYVPSSTVATVLRMAVAGAVFVKMGRQPIEHPIGKTAWRMLLSPFIPLPFVYLLESRFGIPIVVHEVMRMVYCAVIIVSVSRMRVSFNCIYRCCLIALLPNLAIQILQKTNNNAVTDFIWTHYSSGEEEAYRELLSDMEGGFRSGSIFLNPNVYMIVPLFSLIVFLQKDRQKPSILNYAFIVGTAASCLLTGSRTAAIACAIILIIYVLKYATQQSKIIFVVLIVALIMWFGSDLAENYRALNFLSTDIRDNTDSLSVKVNQFYWYWKSTSSLFIYWLTGSIGSRAAYGMDSELGHIYAWFGIFGLVWYVGYLKILFKRNSHLSYYSRPLTYACALCALSASVLLCMPIYSFAALLTLANVQEKVPALEDEDYEDNVDYDYGYYEDSDSEELPFVWEIEGQE